MKIWKTLSGVLSLLIAAFIALQFLFTDLRDLLTHPGQSSGSAGVAGAVVVVAAALAFGGIISLATREKGQGGDISMAILYGVGGVVGLVLAGSHWDLRVWSAWALVCMVAAMVGIGIGEPSEDDGDAEEDSEPVHAPAAPARQGAVKPAATLEQVLTETNPLKRAAAIDALPEREAKNYLKQVLHVFVDRDEAQEYSDALVRTLIVVLAVVGLALVAVVAVGIFGALGFGPAAAVSPASSASQSAQQSERVMTDLEPSQDVQPVSNPIPGSGTLGDIYVEIKDAYLTSDYQGNPAVVVTYVWTNNGQETTNAMAELVEQTFQNGVELEMATITSSQRYEAGTRLRDVRPGAQTEVQCAFHLDSITSPIEFEISEFMSGSGTVVYSSFNLATLAVEE